MSTSSNLALAPGKHQLPISHTGIAKGDSRLLYNLDRSSARQDRTAPFDEPKREDSVGADLLSFLFESLEGVPIRVGGNGRLDVTSVKVLASSEHREWGGDSRAGSEDDTAGLGDAVPGNVVEGAGLDGLGGLQ